MTERMPTVVLEPKSCFRCGEEFRAFERARICPACRRPNGRRAAPRPGEMLSVRERQVCALIMRASLNKEIAYKLHLTEGTVKEYLNRIFRKLGLKSRTALAVWCMVEQSSGITIDPGTK